MKVKVILVISVIFIFGQILGAKDVKLSPTERKKMNIEIKKKEKRVNAISKEVEQYKSDKARLDELEARLDKLNNIESLPPELADANLKLENTEQGIVHINEKIEYYKSVTKGMEEEEIQIKEMRENVKTLNKEIK